MAEVVGLEELSLMNLLGRNMEEGYWDGHHRVFLDGVGTKVLLLMNGGQHSLARRCLFWIYSVGPPLINEIKFKKILSDPTEELSLRKSEVWVLGSIYRPLVILDLGLSRCGVAFYSAAYSLLYEDRHLQR